MSGYASKNLSVTVVGDSVDLGIISLDVLFEQTVSFCGIIVDSLSRLPVGGARIQLRGDDGDGRYPLLEFFTDSTGLFRHPVSLSNTVYGRIYWSVWKTGYYKENGVITDEVDSVRQTILLKPLGSIRVHVKGKVIDSTTMAPIEHAFVLLSTNYDGAQVDSSYTGADGVFVREVQAGITTASIPSLWYRISAPGYTGQNVHRDMTSLTLAPMDLGEVGLDKTSTVYREPQSNAAPGSAFTLSIPARHSRYVTLDFTLPHPEQVSVEIYAVSGSKIAVLADTRLTSGPHNLSWDTRNVAKGCYTARIKVGSNSYSKSIPVLW